MPLKIVFARNESVKFADGAEHEKDLIELGYRKLPYPINDEQYTGFRMGYMAGWKGARDDGRKD